MVKLLGRVRRRVEIQRELLQLLRDDRLVVAAASASRAATGGLIFSPKRRPRSVTIRSASWPFGRIGGEGQRAGRASASLSSAEVFGSAPAIATTGLSVAGPSSSATTPSSMSLVAGSIQISALAAEQAHRAGFVGERRRVRLHRAGRRSANFARAERFEQPRAPARATALRRGRGTDRSGSRGSGWSTARPIDGLARLHLRRLRARRVERQPRDDLVGDDVGRVARARSARRRRSHIPS